MTPTFTTEFNLITKKLIITDTFNYVDSVIDTAFGNATIKIGNQILHTNTNFNSSADIVYNVNNSFQIDLPLNADGTVRETGYEVTYDVRFTVNTVADVAADTFTVVTIPTNVGLAALINESIAAGVGMKATFNVGSTSGYTILSATSTTLIFASTTISGAASGLTSAIVASTSNSEAIENYIFCDITPIADLCVESDCFYATLTASDTTPYLASQTILERFLTINFPRLANGNPIEGTVETSEASQTIGPNLYTGGYLVTLSTAITWTQTDGLIVTNTVAARSDYTVNCEGSICSAFNCIKAYMIKYQQAVAKGGRELANFTAQNFQILLYCNLYNIAIQCQDTAEARAILVALGEYMSTSGVTVAGCDCGCGQSSTNTNQPTVIYPLYNSAVYNSATELARGIIELATLSEASAGTDQERAITPYSLKHVLDSRVATESQTGLAEIATQAETDAGTNDTRIVTPIKLQKTIFNPVNSNTGFTDITLDKKNGKLEYATTLPAGATSTFILQNTLITVDSIILYSVKYQNSNQAVVIVPTYSIPSDGILYFNVKNIGAQTTNADIVISFTILNP